MDMYDVIFDLVYDFGFRKKAEIITRAILCIISICVVILIQIIFKKLILRNIIKVANKTNSIWINSLLERKAFHFGSHVPSPVVFWFFAQLVFDDNAKPFIWIERSMQATFVLLLGITINIFFNGFVDAYNKIRPNLLTNGMTQSIKIGLYAIVAIICISIMFDKSPVVLLSGLGAATALITFIFKDTFTGFIAGIHIATNRLAKIGDWVVLPKINMEGSIQEMTLTTIKIKCFDKSILTIPSHYIISEPFKNCAPFLASNVKIMKKFFYVDVHCVRFLTKEEKKIIREEDWSNIHFEYREENVSATNKELLQKTFIFNEQATNLQAFRFYIQKYLGNHPLTLTNNPYVVRTKSASEYGLQFEILSFCNSADYYVYRYYVSEILEYVATMAAIYEIRFFQLQHST